MLPMQLNLRQIEAFSAAMEFGSATAASQALHITQPAVSRLLADLEARVGFQLFERKARGLTPTQDARILYDEVRRSFIGLDRIAKVADGIRETASGTIRVIALSKYADGFVATILGRFVRDYPGVGVELDSAGTAGVVQGIASQNFDVGIASATVSDAIITAEPLFITNALLAIAPDDPLTASDVVPLAALNRRRMFSLPKDSEYGTVIDRALRDAQATPQIAGVARTHASLCRMVEAGGGVALVDRTMAEEYAGIDIEFRPVEPPVTRTVATLINSRQAPSSATRTFLNYLRENASKTLVQGQLDS